FVLIRDSAPSYCLLYSFCSDFTTNDIYTLSLHDALPILIFMSFARNQDHVIDARGMNRGFDRAGTIRLDPQRERVVAGSGPTGADRKSTRLNSSHVKISYAVFCLKKKKKT